jgi:hypothetical protein
VGANDGTAAPLLPHPLQPFAVGGFTALTGRLLTPTRINHNTNQPCSSEIVDDPRIARLSLFHDVIVFMERQLPFCADLLKLDRPLGSRQRLPRVAAPKRTKSEQFNSIPKVMEYMVLLHHEWHPTTVQ